MLHYLLFFIFAGVCLAGALFFLLQRHPVNSALSLIVVMGSLAALFLMLGAEFVAAVQVIVYAGAVMVLFVFVIMLLNAGEEERTRGSKVALILGVPGLIVFFCLMYWTLALPRSQVGHVSIGDFYVSTQQLGIALFREFLLPFEVTSVLVLIPLWEPWCWLEGSGIDSLVVVPDSRSDPVRDWGRIVSYQAQHHHDLYVD